MPIATAPGLFYVFTMLGVAVFAASGALAAGRRKLDLVGVTALAVVTAVGGGTLRDVLLDRYPVFWITDPSIISVCLATSAGTWVWVRYFKPPYRALQYADAVGLAMFSITGAQIAEDAAMPELIVVVMGTVTGCAGGLLRDVLTAEIPLIFRKSELYVTTCVTGLISYVLLRRFAVDAVSAGIAGAAIILAFRLASIRWNLTLPTMELDEGSK